MAPDIQSSAEGTKIIMNNMKLRQESIALAAADGDDFADKSNTKILQQIRTAATTDNQLRCTLIATRHTSQHAIERAHLHAATADRVTLQQGACGAIRITTTFIHEIYITTTLIISISSIDISRCQCANMGHESQRRLWHICAIQWRCEQSGLLLHWWSRSEEYRSRGDEQHAFVTSQHSGEVMCTCVQRKGREL
jgi:hypothetical protein